MRFYKNGDTVEYGCSLNEFCEMLDLMGIVDEEFSLYDFLISKGEIDDTGRVIGDTYGLFNYSEKVDKGLFNITEERYIFIPASGIRKFIKEMQVDKKGYV